MRGAHRLRGRPDRQRPAQRRGPAHPPDNRRTTGRLGLPRRPGHGRRGGGGRHAVRHRLLAATLHAAADADPHDPRPPGDDPVEPATARQRPAAPHRGAAGVVRPLALGGRRHGARRPPCGAAGPRQPGVLPPHGTHGAGARRPDLPRPHPLGRPGRRPAHARTHRGRRGPGAAQALRPAGRSRDVGRGRVHPAARG